MRGVQFSLVACEAWLCHRFHIYGIWTSRYGGYLKTSSIGGDDACHESGALFIGKASSHYVTLLYCETLQQLLLGGYCKIFYWIPLFTILLLFYVFQVGKAKSATQSVLMILTLNGLFQKNCQVFYFKPENSISLTLSPLPPLFVFFHYSVYTIISDCNHPFDTSTFTHAIQSHRNTLLQLKIHI